MQTLLVVDDKELLENLVKDVKIVNAIDYLSDDTYANGLRYRVINLCQSYTYQTTGYYVSLLAEARRHKVIPSVMTIQDVYKPTLSNTISQTVENEIQTAFHKLKSDEFTLSIYFGKNIAKRYEIISRKLYSLFPMPLFRVFFKYTDSWKITKIKSISIKDISEAHREFFEMVAKEYFSKKRFHFYRHKPKYYDLAILHNPDESTPPSNKKSLEKFIHAGESLGIAVDLIDKASYKNIAEYDGLFIRENTNVNHYTYNFSRKASSEGLIVIDDPLSILRCCNKVYLTELMQKNRIATPRTWFISKVGLNKTAKELCYPCVLKLPDSAFSKGVVKVENRDELNHKLKQFFKHSDIIIAQEFLYTDYDWRIGIIDNKPLFACRYYMANGHWQIYNWQNENDSSGEFDCLPIEKVPSIVLKTALKISRHIGDGLYGVDIKQKNNHAYVIEVNDNPNIDHGVEDECLGDDLYINIMQVFLDRIRRAHGYE